MITIEYCKYGVPVSDFNYNEWLNSVIESQNNSNNDTIYQVSTSLPIDIVRLAIVKGDLDNSNVRFLFNGQSFQANEYGAIKDWMKGFCDIQLDVSIDTIKLAIDKRRVNSNLKEKRN